MATLGIGLATSGTVRTTFFPEVPGSIITVTMEMDPQSPYALTQKNAARIERVAHQINDQVIDENEGEQAPISKIMTAILSPQEVQIYAELAPEKERSVNTFELVDRWREQVGPLEGVNMLHFAGSEETGGGFALDLFADDVETLTACLKAVSDDLRAIPGVTDVRNDLKGNQAEIFLQLKPEAGQRGVTMDQVSAFVADQYGGLETQRFQRNGDELRVMVRRQEQDRDALSDILNARYQLWDGTFVPLASLVTFESGYAPQMLRRRNGERAASIRANIDKTQTSSMVVFQMIQNHTVPKLQQTYPDFKLIGAGELEQEGEIQEGLVKALIMAMVLIYALLAIPLKSYSQPFVIMSVVPFGIAGAIAGHAIIGLPLSVLSFFGMLALTGIVVNDSLVLITTFNDERNQGKSIADAIIAAGQARFRAILLTTVTTVAGLTPLMLETSEQAQYLIPAAVSLAFGEIFATAITLIAVPILVVIFKDIAALWTWLIYQPEAASKAEVVSA
jgi:multidrug efflux pump subunit AcrB